MFYKGNNSVSDTYWTGEDFEASMHAEDCKDLFVIVEKILARMPDGLLQVCGPISTGGFGSVEKNLFRFDEKIKELQAEGRPVFDQMYLEAPIMMLRNKGERQNFHMEILNDLYLPIFKSGKISKVYFLKGWESSQGATWEHNLAKELGFEIEYEK